MKQNSGKSSRRRKRRSVTQQRTLRAVLIYVVVLLQVFRETKVAARAVACCHVIARHITNLNQRSDLGACGIEHQLRGSQLQCTLGTLGGQCTSETQGKQR